MKKVLAIILVLILMISNLAITSTVIADVNFNDVKNNDWFYSNLTKMIDLGIVNGYEDGTFKPNNTLKYEEYIKLIITAKDNDVEVQTGSMWYKPYMDCALNNNYITSADYQYVGEDITRKQMAEIIYNVLKNEIVSLNDREKEYVANKFIDLNTTDDKLLHIATIGIINGYPDKTFKPNNCLTRAEATTVIIKLLDNSIRTPINIVLPKILADFPEPNLEYLYNYTTLRGVTARENYKNIISTGRVHPCKQVVDTATNFIELLINRDYRTINNKSITNVFYNDTISEITQKTLSFKDWLLYYTNASQEYCSKKYYNLRSNFLNSNPSYSQEQADKEIDRWFEFF